MTRFTLLNDWSMMDTVDEGGDEAVPDYLRIYRTEGGFDFPELINDDYFEAIHLLWNNRKYVSCLKLVFSTIDTFGIRRVRPGRWQLFHQMGWTSTAILRRLG